MEHEKYLENYSTYYTLATSLQNQVGYQAQCTFYPQISSTKPGTFTVGVMSEGAAIWTDETVYKFKVMPSELEGGILFSCPTYIPDGSVLTLNGGGNGTMYAFLTHGRGGSYKYTLPRDGWTTTSLRAEWKNAAMDVLKKSSSIETLPESHGGYVMVAFGFVPSPTPIIMPG